MTDTATALPAAGPDTTGLTPLSRTTALVCDASFCDRTRTAGWAAALVRPDGTTSSVSAPIENGFSSINGAEQAAALRAMQWAEREGHLVGLSRLLLVTDSMAVRHKLAPGYVSRRNRRRLRRGLALPVPDPATGFVAPLNAIRLIASRHGVKLDVVHANGRNTRKRRTAIRLAFVAVDRASREAMRQAQSRFLQGQIRLNPIALARQADGDRP
jgi:ribonuclease HI